MKRMVLGGIACAVLYAAWALEWPSEQPIFQRLFGQRIHTTTFEHGLIFDNPPMVRSADSGMLLIGMEKKYGMRYFPSTLGNALIFSHEDGLQTVYGNLESTGFLQNRLAVETGNPIGKTGNSGWGTAGTLIFQVIDTQNQAYINPQLLLPAVEDSLKPQMQNVFLVSESQQRIPLNGQKTIRKGSYDLYADVWDTIENGKQPLNTFRISVFVNGATIRTLPFETITQKNGAVYLGATALTDSLLFQQSSELYLGKIILNRGKSDIMITARDITGNEKSEIFSVHVD
ncbi:MAG: peptidoglycan DD-metalloendopeptidase family protein [Treponema sp.]